MFKITNLTIHLNNEISLEEAISKKYRVNKKDINIYRIIKKSIDARDHEDIKFIYSLYVNITLFRFLSIDFIITSTFCPT